MQRLLFSSIYSFVIKLRGPAANRRKDIYENVLKQKQDFFEQYYQNTQQQYKNNFTSQQLKDTSDQVRRVFSLENATAHEILKYRIGEAVKKFQTNINDHGSSAVQCAVLSQRIIFMMIHVKKYTKDKNGIKSLTSLIHQRRKMLNYLMRTDYHRYSYVCSQYNLPQVYPKYAFHQKKFGATKNSWQGKYS